MRKSQEAKAWGVAGLVTGLIAGGVIAITFSSALRGVGVDALEEVHEGQRGLINPLLACGSQPNQMPFARTLEEQLRDRIQAEVESGNMAHVSVYFRDLNNGPWFGINESEGYIPGSLLKVMVMMEFFKAADADPAVLSEKVQIPLNARENPDLTQPRFPPEVEIQPGSTYTVLDLIEAAILHSDNLAVAALLQTPIAQRYLIDPCRTRDGRIICQVDREGRINVVDYAGLFRILYNASYLSDARSVHALKLLTQTRFRAGLVAGVPAGVLVAHKFGERETGQLAFFHDCGIVYHPQRPYLLCILTQSNDLARSPAFVSELSKLVYDAVEQAGASGG